jgi:nicotinate-nucleotide adenylyltransferase
MKRVSLFFGSFNPIHLGHTRIAQAAHDQGTCDEVWFVVSPQNPFKTHLELAPAEWRVELVKVAIEGLSFAKVCDIELTMPIPNYTCNTLRLLFDRFPDIQFSILMGEDQLPRFHEWRESQWIIEHVPLWVYPRGERVESDVPHRRISCETMDVSSTMIRARIADHKSTSGLLDEAVSLIIERDKWYR